MIALGGRARPNRWFGSPLEDGVHLRWAFRAELGFPAGGFVLHRRDHLHGTFIDLPATAFAPNVIALPQRARHVQAVFSHKGWRPGVRRPSPPPRVTGLYEDVPIAAGRVSRTERPNLTVAVKADAMDAIRIDARRWRLESLRYVPASPETTPAWSALGTVCLPLTDPAYPCHPGPVNIASDRNEAANRLAGHDGQIDAALIAQYLAEEEWKPLHEQLRRLFNPPIPSSMSLKMTVEGQPPGVGITPVDLMLLGSIDPYFARIIGLYWIDRAAVPDRAYDYKVTGKWLKTQLKSPETTFDFERSHVGLAHPQTFLRETFLLRSVNTGSIEDVDLAPWQDTRRALDLRPFTDTGTVNRPAYLRIQLPEPVSEVQLYLRVYKGSPRIASGTANAQASTWKSADSNFIILTVAAATADQLIESVTVDPATGTADLHLALCKVGLIETWTAPIAEERAWVCYEVKSDTPDPLAAPAGLSVDALVRSTTEANDGSVTGGPRAGLTWAVPLEADTLLPRQAVRYLIQRKRLGSGEQPASIDGGSWDDANADAPLALSAEEERPQQLFFDDPGTANAPPDRHYGYRVAGIDLFGRVSPWSAPFVADLTDVVAPPPPLHVEASLAGPQDVRVRWTWPVNLRAQAPDAREFRVYTAQGRSNVISGRVTAVAANADGTLTVTTDQTIPASAVNAFAGDRLSNRGVSFEVVQNTAGADFQLVVRQPAAPPPLSPARGAFSVSVRPPRPLGGVIVKRTPHLAGAMTLVVELTGEVAADALTGKWLRQGGRDFRIAANTAGATSRLTVVGRAMPARLPGKGQCAILDEDRTTPLVADAGNPLYVDYGRAANWSARARVEMLTASDAYEVTIPAESAYVNVAVSTADDKAYVPDDTTWDGTANGNSFGNEGALSSPVVVQKAVRHIPDDRLPAPDFDEPTRADYYGRSFVGVDWPEVPGSRIEIYRALDEAIFAADRNARSWRSTDRAEYSWLDDDRFDALVVAPPLYGNLNDELFQTLAGLPGNESAFVLTDPLSHEGDSATVEIPGRVRNRMVFATRAVDAAGNRTVLGWPSRVVRAPSALPPRAPVITAILGGDRVIELTWAANRETDVTEYRVYRAETETDAGDIRHMSLIGSGMMLTWSDATSPVAANVFYRVVAVSAAGVASEPSVITAGRAYDDRRPAPPVWQTPIVTTDGVELAWSLADPIHQALVQRRHRYLEPPSWESVTGWLAAGSERAVDATRAAGRSYIYRIRVQDAARRTNRDFNELEL